MATAVRSSSSACESALQAAYWLTKPLLNLPIFASLDAARGVLPTSPPQRVLAVTDMQI
jgi:hypothetical protein